MAMATKTIPEYLEDERRNSADTQLRTEEEAARIQPLQHGHHRTAKQPKLELASPVEPAAKTRTTKVGKTAAGHREKPRAARKKETKARKAA